MQHICNGLGRVEAGLSLLGDGLEFCPVRAVGPGVGPDVLEDIGVSEVGDDLAGPVSDGALRVCLGRRLRIGLGFWGGGRLVGLMAFPTFGAGGGQSWPCEWLFLPVCTSYVIRYVIRSSPIPYVILT